MAPAMEHAEFGILGAITVALDGGPVVLGGPKQRALLGVLLLRAGTPVAVDELIGAVWGDAPPPTAAKSVQVCVTNLRRLLGRPRIRTQGAAYALEIADGELDAREFEQLAAEGSEALRGGDDAVASELLARALALWRGGVCEDVAFESHVNAEAERLEELYRSALHDRIEADLALARQARLVPELERLVALHPLDEELRAQQMRALYRCGRQGDALRVYREARQHLVDQLGVEPGDSLRALERRILEHDPELAPPARAETAAEARLAAPLRSRARFLVAVGITVMAVGTVVAFTENIGSKGMNRTIAADAVGVIDAADGRIRATVPAGPNPSAIVYADGSAWIADAAGDTVMRIDHNGHVADAIPVGGNVTAIASSGNAVWAISGERRTLDEIDPGTDTVVRRIAVGNGPRAVAEGAGGVWVANGIDGTISRINPHSGRPLATIPVGGTPVAIAVGNGAVWVANADTNTVLRLDPSSNAPIASVAVGHSPDAIVAGGGSVWVANRLDGTVSRIDAATDSVNTTVSVGADPTSLAQDGHSIWVGSGGTDTVAELDVRTGRLRRRIRIGNSPAAVAVAGKQLWVSAVASPRSRRGGTLRLLGKNLGDPTPSFDPATAWSAEDWQVLAITNDGLLTYRRAGGIEGNDLEPDLAQSNPTVGANGKSYTFRLRPGIRYSNGGHIRATDVRASIERRFRLRSPTLGASLGLVGESACLARPRRCDLSRGIVTDNRTGTVTFHLSHPNPAFLRILALPVYDVLPAGVSPHAHIATGPYRIASLKHGLLRLVRNSRFRQWSPDAQPDGFPDRISWNLRTPPARGAQQVLAGRADVLVPTPPGVVSLSVHEPALLHSDRNGFIRYLFLNTRRAPFDHLDVRKALNLAMDRGEAVAAFGGSVQAEPTCQVLPPNMDGYRPYCPYTLHPGPAGTWSAPDLAAARRLVARSGTRGQRIGVWTQADRPMALALGRHVAALLRSLGYRASLIARPVQPADPANGYFQLVTSPHARAQIGVNDWIADYNSPADFFQPLLTCSAVRSPGGLNLSRFCDPRIDREIARANALDRTASPDASAAWAAVDRAVVDQAPLVPIVSDRQVTLVSQRVGDYEYNANLGGVLIDQLWISNRGA